MPVPAAAVLSILAGTSKSLLEVPMIHRWIENFLDGLDMTFWDALLWHGLIEKVWGVKSPKEKEEIVTDHVEAIQASYNKVKELVKEGVTEPDAIKKVTGIDPFAVPWMDNAIGEG